jgi:hypothetical protein
MTGLRTAARLGAMLRTHLGPRHERAVDPPSLFGAEELENCAAMNLWLFCLSFLISGVLQLSVWHRRTDRLADVQGAIRPDNLSVSKPGAGRTARTLIKEGEEESSVTGGGSTAPDALAGA